MLRDHEPSIDSDSGLRNWPLSFLSCLSLLDGLAPGRSFFPLTFFFRVPAMGNNYRRFIPSQISCLGVGESENSTGELWRRVGRGILTLVFEVHMCRSFNAVMRTLV